MNVLAGILLVTLIAWGCASYAARVFSRRAAGLLLLVKVLVGFAAPAYYFLYEEGGDLVYYHESATHHLAEARSAGLFFDFLSEKADPAGETTPQGRTFFFVKLLTVLYWFTGGSFVLASLVFSLAGFAALIYFIRAPGPDHPEYAFPLTCIFLFWPNIAIWGSGLGKESLMLSSMLVLSAAVLRLCFAWRRSSLVDVLLLLASLFFLIKVRFFVAMLFLPCLAGYLFFYSILNRMSGLWQKILIVSAAVVLPLSIYLLSLADANFRPGYFLQALADNHASVVAASRPAHIIGGLEELREWPGLLWQLVPATLAGLLGPFVWEINSGWEMLLFLEIAALVALAVCNRCRCPGKLPPQLLVFASIYLLAVASAITLSTPNYGTLSRYRLAWYPVFVFLLVCGHPWLTKISRLINFKKG